MTSHRLRFGVAARGIAQALFTDRARGETLALADLTNKGRAIQFTLLGRNERGPRIRMYGQRCHAEAGLDDSRLDTLFVFKLVAQPLEIPEQVHRYEASFQDLLYQHALELDPIGPLFAQNEAPPQPVARRPRVEITERLRNVLATAPHPLRGSLYPPADSPTPTLDSLRTAWKRLVDSVRRRPAAPTRNDQILGGVVTPHDVGVDALIELRQYFEAVFVSQVLEERVASPDRLLALTQQFAVSPIPADLTRSLLWAAAVHNDTPTQLRDELRVIARRLAVLSDSARQQPWWDAICRLIYALRSLEASESSERAIVDDLLALATNADDADESDIAFLARWAVSEPPAMADLGTPRAPSERAVTIAPPVPTPAGRPAAEPVALGVEDRLRIQSWILQQRGVTHEDAANLRSALQGLCDDAASVAGGLGDVAGWIRVPTLAQRMRELLGSFQLEFAEENVAEWQRLRDESERVFHYCAERAGRSAVTGVLSRRAVAPADLKAAAELFELRALWSSLPDWWWPQFQEAAPGDVQEKPATPDDTAFLDLFCIARARNLTRAACERLQAVEQALLPGVALIPAPPDGTSADEHLAAQIGRLGNALGHSRQKYQSSLTTLLDGGQLTPQDFADLADDLDDVEHRVSEAAFKELVAECSRLGSGDHIRPLLRSVDRALSLMAAAVLGDGVPQEDRDEFTRGLMWKYVKAKSDELRRSTATAGPQRTLDLRLHWADVGTPQDPKDKPPLFFRPHNGDETAAFGFVRAPIVVRASRPRALDLHLQLTVDTDPLRKGWPTDGAWGSAKPEPLTRTIREQEWHKDDAGYQVTMSLTVPVRRPPSTGHALAFTLSARDGAWDGLSVERSYEWDRLVVEGSAPPVPDLAWSNSEEPTYAEQVPVGPQVHLEEILGRIAAGNSLAVTAPRRFGKSSLIALLERKLAQAPDTVVIRVDCSSAATTDASALNHNELWKLISAELANVTEGVTLDATHEGQPPLPTPSAFQKVRSQARRLGKTRIVVFLDEAQRLFDAGPAYGARLRTLIASHLGRQVDGLAKIVFCFVGLPSMTRERLGEDLYPQLNPVAHDELREDQVARVVTRVMGGRLFTTRAARERIARSAWNLYALRTMLSRLRRYVRDDFRMWAGIEDVIAVERALNDELRSGRDPDSIATYVRDSLNAGATADNFQPIHAYPVAVGYALALDDNRVGKDALEATVRTLNEWAGQIFRDQLSRPTYDPASVERHLKALQEQNVLEQVRDILGGYRFRSEFLRHYLVGKTPHFIYGDDVFREALLRGGSRTIRLPADRTAIGRGVQAEVYRFKREVELAARVRELRSADEQKAFLNSLGLLEKLRSIHAGNREGAEGIYKLVEVGLLPEQSPVKAVEVYHYIPGVDLSSKLGQLGAAIVVPLGISLARALVLVHDHDVLHRDIRPANIILQDHTPTPVLIDFGLACARSAPGGTPLDDELTAPEVKGQTPQWTTAADVFALAMTLRRLLPGARARQEDQALDKALQAFTTPDTNARSSVWDLLQALEKMAMTLQLDRRLQDYETRLLQVIAGDRFEDDLRWLIRTGGVLEIKGFAFGLYAHPRDRQERVAHLVNKAAERIKKMAVGAWAKSEYGDRRWPPAISTIVSLRNNLAHGGERRIDVSDELVRAGTKDIEAWVGTSRLGNLVDDLLRS